MFTRNGLLWSANCSTLAVFLINRLFIKYGPVCDFLQLLSLIFVTVVSFRILISESLWLKERLFAALSILWALNTVVFAVTSAVHYYSTFFATSKLSWSVSLAAFYLSDSFVSIVVVLLISVSFLQKKPFFYAQTASRKPVALGALGVAVASAMGFVLAHFLYTIGRGPWAE